MKFAFTYYPIQYYLITILASLALIPIAYYLSSRDQTEKILPLLLINLFVPCITAVVMIYSSGNQGMIQDFWERLFLFKVQPGYLAVILLLMPCTILLATVISLAFGYSSDQFSLAKELSVMKGWSLLGILIPLLLAPLVEELGWRGYGVDSLRASNNLFTTSVIFGALWALWHLPLFFVKGYYQNQLWDLGFIHVLNFFVSVFVVAFLMNWVYYHTDRSIPAIVLFHSMLNLSSILFRTEPVTKCIATVLLCAVLTVVLIQDKSFFFRENLQPAAQTAGSYKHVPTTGLAQGQLEDLNQRLQLEVTHLQKQYDFPGATVSYVLSNGRTNTIAVGLADIESGQPMTSNSRMLAASIGKTFVAATILALDKEDRLNLDDPLSSWLGDRSWYARLPNSKTITLRHLLTHSAGLPDHVKMENYPKLFVSVDPDAIPEQLVELILDTPPLFNAGEGWSYTDTGYILLGLVIEAASGNSYYDEVEQRFLKPLGLEQTSPSDRAELAFLASGYTPENNFFGLPPKTVDREGMMLWNPAIEWTGGGLISSSRDLARWAKLLYEGKALPYDYVVDLLQSIPVGEQGEKIHFGLGVAIEDRGVLGKRYGHGGVIPGYTSSMRYYPRYGIAIAFQINTDRGMWDHSTNFVVDMEKRLEEIIINS